MPISTQYLWTPSVSLAVTMLLANLLCGQTVPSAAPSRPKNFVFFLVDDLGWADLGCNGSDFYETPHIDALAASGMRFTQAYAACPVCSPTRASILTGRHPVRVDITDWIPGSDTNQVADARFEHVRDRDNLSLEEVTIAELLREGGYQTFFAGKWHLGDQGHWPTNQGFDFNLGGNSLGSPPGGYYAPWKNPTLTAYRDGEYLTERLTSEVIRFLLEHDVNKPFLIYLSYYNVHTPITPYERRVEYFQAKAAARFTDPTPTIAEHDGTSRARQDNAPYASMIAAVDDSVGSILQHLEHVGIAQDTVVVFFSDNGGLCTLKQPGPTSNLPLRAGKGWLYEGGIREPAIVRVPGMTEPGSVCDSPIVSMDFFPTLLQLAELPLRPDLHVDGISLVPLLQQSGPSPARQFYWHYPHYHGSMWKPGAAVRDGDWKLIEHYHHETTELYNLANDPGEQHDLSGTEPVLRNALRQQLSNWQQQLRARMPVPKRSTE